SRSRITKMELPNLGYGIIGKPVSYLYGVP
ncbi:MAG: hypothetical protein ACI81P_003687, partial [Neolewinella sp.]